VSKRDIQKQLGKINYLCHFISNLAGRVESLLPLIRLKHEEEFTWGQNSKKLLRRSKKVGNPFKMYIAAQEWVIGAVLLQEEDDKEFPVAYVN
jgi:hypothetical protein